MSELVIHVNAEIQSAWEEERRVATAGLSGTVALTADDVYERRHEYDAVASRLQKRIRIIQRMAREEGVARRGSARDLPDGLAHYVAGEGSSLRFYPSSNTRSLTNPNHQTALRSFMVKNPFTCVAVAINASRPLISLKPDLEAVLISKSDRKSVV